LDNHRIYYKLIAISALKKNSIQDICQVFNINRITLYRWVLGFKNSGISGLADKPKGHMPSKLSSFQKKELQCWVESKTDSSGIPTDWTIHKLRAELKQKFGITISYLPLWKHLQKMRLILPRKRKNSSFSKL
jgi:transposase